MIVEKGKKEKKKRVRYLSKEEERSEKETNEWKVITAKQERDDDLYRLRVYPREKKLRIN